MRKYGKYACLNINIARGVLYIFKGSIYFSFNIKTKIHAICILLVFYFAFVFFIMMSLYENDALLRMWIFVTDQDIKFLFEYSSN